MALLLEVPCVLFDDDVKREEAGEDAGMQGLFSSVGGACWNVTKGSKGPRSTDFPL